MANVFAKLEIDDDLILMLVVKRKPDHATGLDTLEIVKPTDMQDTLRINSALNHAQKTLFDLTKKALKDSGVKDLR